MFDRTPISTRTATVATTSVSTASSGQRLNFHYIDNLFNPDTHDIDDIDKYVVPNEGELVFDVPNGLIYRVSHVDTEATYKSTLSLWNIQNQTAEATYDQDDIFGTRGGPLAGEALLAIDYSIRPNVARVDSTIMRPGAAYAKLFKNNDISEDGTIISATYDSAGNMINNQVPTVLAAFDDLDNRTIYTTGSFSVTANEEEMPDGQRATLVFYDTGGNFIPPVQPVMVQHSAYLRDHQINMKYITNIELVAPWFTDATDPETLLVPVNTDLLSIEFRGRVTYSDGSTELLPVNSDRFNLIGLTEHRPTYAGQTAEIVLIYNFQEDEQAYMADPGSPNHKTKTYTIKATEVAGAYSPRIYTIPQWDYNTGQYKLTHYLYDLDRHIRHDITNLVTLNTQSPPFAPTNYGSEQNLIFNINLKDVSDEYESFIYVQHVSIVLYGNVNSSSNQWSVKYIYDNAYYNAYKLPYSVSSNSSIDFTGFSSKKELLDELFYSTDPLHFTASEEFAPEPTHFLFETLDGTKTQFNLDNWDSVYTLAPVVNAGYTHNIYWQKVLDGGDILQLGVTGVTPIAK